MNTSVAPPWGPDALSRFLADSERNTRHSAVNFRKEYEQLSSIHALCLSFGEAIHISPDNVLVPSLLMFLSNASWLAGLRIGLGGQCSDVHPSFRACVEYAGYAVHLTHRPELQNVWLERNKDEEHLKRCRQAFQAVKVSESVDSRCPAEAADYRATYNALIDFGAHPTQRALSSRLELEASGTDIVSTVVQLTDDPRVYARFARLGATVGLVALSLFGTIFADRLVGGDCTTRLADLKQRANPTRS